MTSFFKNFFNPWKTRVKSTIERITQITFVRFAINVGDRIGKDYVGIMAAGLSYYTFLSLFPLILGIVSILGFLLPMETVRSIVFDLLQSSFPGSTDIIESTITSVINNRGTLGIVSIIGLIIAGTGIFSAISLALNRAWDRLPRAIWVRKPMEFAMFLGIGLMVLLLLGASTAISFLGNIDLPGIRIVQMFLGRLISFVLLLGIFFLVYKYIPSKKLRWRDVWIGATLGAVLWQIALLVFSFFLSNFASYQLTYGSLASIIILLVWIYISAFILIICEEINAVYYRMFGAGARTKK